MARTSRLTHGAGAGACALLLLWTLAHAKHDDDFAFDNSEEYQAEITNGTEVKSGLKRLWGVPDTSAYAGHLFRMEIPSEAFSGDVVAYKVRSADGRRAPNWLAVDSRHGLISGVPLSQDIGAHTLQVTAHSHHHTATDSFTIEVRKAEEKRHSRYGTCGASESRMVLVILLDAHFHHIKPKQRIRALMELAKFMALDGDEFSIDSFKSYSGRHTDQTAVMSGPGSSQRRNGEGATTAVYLNVGCAGKLWPRHKVLVAGLREQSRDGSLAHVVQLPVLGWRLLAEKPKLASLGRPKRQLPEEGSGVIYDNEENDDGDYSGYDDEEADYDFDGVEAVTPATPPPAPSPRTPHLPLHSPHPHRHHHGETPDIIPDFPDITSVSVTSPTEKTSLATQRTTPDDIVPTVQDLVPSVEDAPEVDDSRPEVLRPTIGQSPSTYKSTTEERPATFDEISPSLTPFTDSVPSTPSSPEPTTPVPSTTSPPPPPPVRTESPPASPREDTTPPATPSHTTNAILEESDKKVQIVPHSNAGVPRTFVNVTQPSVRLIAEDPIIIVPDNTVTTTEKTPTVLIQASSEHDEVATTVTEPPVAVTTTVRATAATPVAVPTTSRVTTAPTPPLVTPVEQASEVTSQDIPTWTEKTSTIIGHTTEIVEFGRPTNQPPELRYHMKKLAVTAGKAFRYIIPVDLFTDPEDGTNLTYTMFESDNAPLKPTSWVQFLPTKKEVYGLPLEEHVSRWAYTVQATDGAGGSARGPLDITVQHHKGRRTVNHEFSLKLKVQHKYTVPINWQIRVLEGLVNLFRDTDMDHMTVRNVSSHDDLVEFVWTNDTLPKDICPTSDIDRLMAILESPSDKGSPSAALSRVMSPELKVASVSWWGVGTCAVTVAPPVAPPHLDTFPPVPRNQVDLVQAIAGSLLVFKVPQDTFYDPEDGGTRKLRLSVTRGDRSPLPTAHWMQFDARNQEFYGLPTERDVGKKEYQLIAEDSMGKTAHDVLLVEVNPAPYIQAPVEFQMTMNYPYATLAGSALAKRTFVEKLAELFGDKDTSSIRVKAITDKPTTVVWFNTSLPLDRCPNEEIEALKKIIIKEEQQGSESLTDRVDGIFDKHEVMSVRLIPRGLCAEQNTVQTKSSNNVYVNIQNKEESKSANIQEYLVTFIIPAVVVVCMILIAGVIACLLYRRRRTGKMSVGDEEERQAFRSKGIPVIFQDELDEKPDPSNKSPVIMKEEKPPLLPPPDYKPDAESPTPSHHTPYRPPPPFTASRDKSNSRPKATPTYRKPPPYVPP